MLALISRIDAELEPGGQTLVTGWNVHRSYSDEERKGASLFHVWPKVVFEPAGEECGTRYDDSTACSQCHGGAVQVTPLLLDGRRIPKRVDFARTIAGEIVVKARVAAAAMESGMSGAVFEAVRLVNAGGAPSTEYFQLRTTGSTLDVDPATRAGGDLFDRSGYGRCPRGDVIGLNLLSELTVVARGRALADVMTTTQMVGVRRGLLRPRPMLLLSPKALETFEGAGLKGLEVEIART